MILCNRIFVVMANSYSLLKLYIDFSGVSIFVEFYIRNMDNSIINSPQVNKQIIFFIWSQNDLDLLVFQSNKVNCVVWSWRSS